MAVLALDISGTPRTWVSHDEAISYHAKNLVGWSLGDVIARYRGGYREDGTQSYIETPSIIAIKGEGFDFKRHNKVILTNKTLFLCKRNIGGCRAISLVIRNDFYAVILPNTHT